MISIKEAGKIYDGLTVKDMPRAKFIGKLRGLTNQGLMQRDLKAIIGQLEPCHARQVLAEARAKRIQEALR